MALETHRSLLTLYDMGMPLYAWRGLTQTFGIISAYTQLMRDANGGVMDLSYDVFDKIASTITCTDVEAPAFDGVKPGKRITVDCAFEWSFITDSGLPTRRIVSGSDREEGELTFYRPQIDFVVFSWESSFEEYKANYVWRMGLEEA